MPGFLYYIPGRKTVRREELAELGLAYAFPGRATPRGCDAGGPDGGAGCVVVDPQRVPLAQHGYWRERQEWVAAPSVASVPSVPFFVGRTNGQPIAPDDLAREQQLPGHWLELADGNKWLVPIARGYREVLPATDHRPPTTDEPAPELRWSCRLPQRLRLDGSGEWLADCVLDRYAQLWTLAQAAHNVQWGEPAPEDLALLDGPGTIHAAVCALTANYAIGPVEASLLGLLTQELANQIVEALIDVPTILAFQKKTAAMRAAASSSPPAGSSASAGPAATIPTMDRPAPT
jgi:hypothetical protein